MRDRMRPAFADGRDDASRVQPAGPAGV